MKKLVEAVPQLAAGSLEISCVNVCVNWNDK